MTVVRKHEKGPNNNSSSQTLTVSASELWQNYFHGLFIMSLRD